MSTRRALLATAASMLAACAGAPTLPLGRSGAPVTVLRNVTVVTRYGGPRLQRHALAVEGPLIVAVAPFEVLDVPGHARVIDGRGRLVAPGIADMHVHHADPHAGPLFLANGITSVRNPSGSAGLPELIADIENGSRVGPTIHASGQLIDGRGSFWGPTVVADTAEAVRRRVREDVAAGYRAVKLYSLLSPAQFRAGVEEARLHGRRVYAHVPHAMTLEDVLALRVDSVEHLDGFARALGGQGWGQAAWASADPARMAALARRVADSGVWSAPTLVVMLAPERAFADLAAAEAAPPMRYANAALLGFWRSAAARAPVGTDFAAGYALARRGHAHRVRMLSALREAGAPVLIGTDSPNPYLVYGFSLHEELAHFREAGYSNGEILRIATLDAARFLGAEDRFGALEPGMRADLVMLDGDPERDLAALRAPAGVMAAGRWHDAQALAAQLDEVAAIAAATRPAAR